MKLVKVTFGLKGTEPRQYTYLVENNVRAGQVIFPSVKHYQSGKIFGTVGIAQRTANEDSRNGRAMKQEMFEKGINAVGQALTGGESQANIRSQAGQGFMQTQKGANGQYVGTEKSINQYDRDSAKAMYMKTQTARAGVMKRTEEITSRESLGKQPYENYKDYYSRFNGGNKQ